MAAATCGLVAASGPAAGHEELPGVVTVLDGAEPELPAGVRVQVVRSAADQLVLSSDIPEEVEVLADSGEAFLRIGPEGTFANLASPTLHEVLSPEPSQGAAPPPADAGWKKVSDARSFGWYDHRLHPAPLSLPPSQKAGTVVRLGDWRVPLRIGGQRVELLGHRQLTRLAGVVTSTVDPASLQGTGLAVSVASGRVPALVVDAAGAVGAGPVVVFGEAGEPMLRFTPMGTEANSDSRTWALTAGAPATASPPSAEPAWKRITEVPTSTWLDPRATYAPGVPPEDVQRSPSPVVLGGWSVPIEQGGRRLAIQGATTWVPDPVAQRGPEEGGSRAWPAAAAALAVGLLGASVCGALLLRRHVRWRRAEQEDRV